MPYRRRYKRKRRYRRRKGRLTLKKTAAKVRKLGRLIETKDYTVMTTDATLGISPISILPTPLDTDQGVQNQQFIGRKYTVTGLKWRIALTKVNATTITAVRVVGVWIRAFPDTTGSLTFGEVFQQTDEAGVTIPDVLACLKSAHRGNISILFDRRFSMGVRSNDISVGPYHKFDLGYKRMNHVVQLDEDIPHYTRGRCIIFAMSQFGEAVQFQMMTKCYYKDA